MAFFFLFPPTLLTRFLIDMENSIMSLSSWTQLRRSNVEAGSAQVSPDPLPANTEKKEAREECIPPQSKLSANVSDPSAHLVALYISLALLNKTMSIVILLLVIIFCVMKNLLKMSDRCMTQLAKMSSD